MSLQEFLDAKGWDLPFFKRLRLNDSWQATSHQKGMAVPVALKEYLPEFSGGDRRVTLDAQLRCGTREAPRKAILQWQRQRGVARAPEYRITGFISQLRPSAGDILVFQRGLHSLRAFRLLLVKPGSPDFEVASRWAGERRWGELVEGQHPIRNTQLADQMRGLTQESQGAFSLRQVAERPVAAAVRVVRSVAFREVVRQAYGNRCAISKISVSAPDGSVEVEAAHVCPVSEGGSDDPRNGLALTQTVHWAFDKGLVGVDRNKRVIVPARVLNDPAARWLARLHGRRILEPADACLRVHPDALAWHLANRVSTWS